ncbi:MAG: hypothetical protein OXC94_02355 [Chloroflexi bacterium]|nr:hypothetical protein [Chloroflexota bacterium]
MIAAAAVLAAIAFLDAGEEAPVAVSGAGAGAPRATPATPSPRAAAHVTTNLRRSPHPAADVVAVIPGGREAELLGRSEDGAWAQLAYPPGGVEGWARLASFALSERDIAAAPVRASEAGPVTPPVAEPTPAPATPGPDALPDLAIANAFLLPDGRLTVSVSNSGEAPLVEQRISLRVSSAEGEILGVLEIGPTSLDPGAVATAITPVTVSRTGVYILELDRLDTIAEASEFNNRFSRLFVAPQAAGEGGGG